MLGEFLLTSDLGIQDNDGYFWYISREDDVITSAGSRVGPSEIEHTLIKHPAVAISAVVRIPDPSPHRGDQDLDRAAAGLRAKRCAGARDSGLRQGATRRPRISAPRPVRRKPADDGDRQGAAAGAKGTGVERSYLAPLAGRGRILRVAE